MYDGLTYGDLEDAAPGTLVESGRYLLVGDHDAKPAVAQVVEDKANGVVLLRVLPGPAEEHQSLVGPRPA